MDILNYLLTAFIYLALLSICYGQSPTKQIVVIDPGHGGSDTGAIGVNGVAEKDIVLSIAKKLDSLNTILYDSRFDIYLTRCSDTLISLRDRTWLAKGLKADVFISLHCNQAVNKRAKGTEVYVDEKQKRYTKASIRMGNFIQDELHDMLGFRSRGVKLANFQVLRQTTDSCPAVLLELGFLSSIDEAGHLNKEEKHNGIGLAILESIIKNR
ncbi:N-acetylmuramoyl-L-alanine amidase [Aggregatimonas sangjinii]|uniref:N-acetylmuramoyl-L-alanine amidase n=2 Tax=Aggregatimonas sangjinii TaxID=2583587 RepID=A0A5B7SU92_9FLAO|nr:N-acetylmuramoyl-L-alanine amidase [Aggregatimonas sangjinii]